MVDDHTVLGLEHEMGVLIRRLRRRIADRARLVHPELGAVGYSMLMALNDAGPQRASSLVDLFGIDKGAVSRQVQLLLEYDLVERTPDPADGRAQILALSEHGRRQLERVAAARREQLTERLAEWDDQELQQLVDLLSRYNRSADHGDGAVEVT